ncbi:MAG: hypothetical protein ABIQ16_07195 [Polyangiaceae bacterium]
MSHSNRNRTYGAFTALLGLVASLGACALQAGNGISTPDDEPLAAASAAVLTSYTTEYTWEQHKRSRRMLPSKGNVCFLTGIHGKFSSTDERVKISNVRGFWYLTGSSRQVGVGATARCFPYEAAKVIATQINYSAATSDLDLGAHRVCALSRVSGDFQGDGDVVEIYQASDGHWFLHTSAVSSELNGGAICLDDATTATLGVSQILEVKGGNAVIAAANLAPDRAQPSEPLKGSACFLTRMTGKFTGQSERVETFPAQAAGAWNFYLRAQGASAASAVCLN